MIRVTNIGMKWRRGGREERRSIRGKRGDGVEKEGEENRGEGEG